MKNMRRVDWVNFAIVLLLLLGSAGSLFVLGRSELKRAEQASAINDMASAGRSYARAARLMPWRNELWDQAGIRAGAGGTGSRWRHHCAAHF